MISKVFDFWKEKPIKFLKSFKLFLEDNFTFERIFKNIST